MSRPVLLAAGLLLLALAGPARANCAAPTTYSSTVTGNTVSVCLENFDARKCPDQGLLRRDPGTGEVVSLSDCDPAGCFVDECVPVGTYQYGLKTPYACKPASCGTYYFTEVTVSAPLGLCMRTPGLTGPTAYTEGVPWGSNATICSYGGMASCGCGSTGVAAVFSLNALALGAGVLLRARGRKRRSP